MAEEVNTAAAESPEVAASPEVVLPELKRKLGDLNAAADSDEEEPAAKENGVEDEVVVVKVKRPRIDLEADASGLGESEEEEKFESVSEENEESPETESVDPHVEDVDGQLQPSIETADAEPTSNEDDGQITSLTPEVQEASHGLSQEDLPEKEASKVDGEPVGGAPTSRRIQVPNSKVGVLIGKGGETIKFLQNTSGAQIQITRDGDADPISSMRSVELIGSLESVDKAEQLIKDVISEAEAGGSPGLIAKGFGASHSNSDGVQMLVPNDKVGLIIGKGGETIKKLQSKSGARIQLIPQHLPEGDTSKERIVRITGSKREIEMAREMIKDAINQIIIAHSHVTSRPSGQFPGQHGFNTRGPSDSSAWPPPRNQSHMAQQNYNYQQRGMHPSQTQQYPSQQYGGGGYSHHAGPPRNNFNPGWEHRPPFGPMQGPAHGGYDYYGQGGQPHGGNIGHGSSQQFPSNQQNYLYGQPHGHDMGQSANYYNSTPSFHQGYDNQASGQPSYGGSQSGYPPQHHGPSAYTQPPYNKPPAAYGVPPSQVAPPQSYGMPRPGQPGDMTSYQQGPASNPAAYGQTGAAVNMQQQYPYGQTNAVASQQAYPYGAAPTANDGYAQQQAATVQAAAYGQQVASNASYSQGIATQPVYGQGGQQPAPYAQYPTAQSGYGEQQVAQASYGAYQGSADASAYNASAAGGVYGAPGVANQAAGYGQQPGGANAPANYEQPGQQANYGASAAPAPVG